MNNHQLRNRVLAFIGLVGAGLPDQTLAHGEQVLLLFAPGMFLVLVGLVCLVLWRSPWRVKGTLFLVLIGSIAATWFLPILPQTIAGLAGERTSKIVLVALGIPIVACLATYYLLRRLLRHGD